MSRRRKDVEERVDGMDGGENGVVELVVAATVDADAPHLDGQSASLSSTLVRVEVVEPSLAPVPSSDPLESNEPTVHPVLAGANIPKDGATESECDPSGTKSRGGECPKRVPCTSIEPMNSTQATTSEQVPALLAKESVPPPKEGMKLDLVVLAEHKSDLEDKVDYDVVPPLDCDFVDGTVVKEEDTAREVVGEGTDPDCVITAVEGEYTMSTRDQGGKHGDSGIKCQFELVPGLGLRFKNVKKRLVHRMADFFRGNSSTRDGKKGSCGMPNNKEKAGNMGNKSVVGRIVGCFKKLFSHKGAVLESHVGDG
ncbi:hypothetical protein HDU93_007691 [Gonapodya sp. JEL0774]|nr:hypothetical protein HDU93_007691 [Gonapodya sp. JEL0774]